MVSKTLVLVAVCIASVSAHYGVAGMYENLPLDTKTQEAYQEGSGNDGFASGADAIAIDTDCSTKEDGLYAIGGCSPQFLTCSGGIARIMDCPANLIYDPRIIACEYSYNVPECGGTPQDVTSTQQSLYSQVTDGTTETPSEDVTSPTNSYSPVEVTPTTPSYEAPAETTAVPYVSVEDHNTAVPAADEPVTRSGIERSCVGKPDGFYSYGECSDHYTACSNGYLIPMQCPARLAFDEARVICDYVINVPECQNGSGNDEGSAEETTTEASGELPYGNGYGYEETTTAAQEDPSTQSYVSVTEAQAYAAPYGIPSTTAADVPSTTELYVPVVIETTTTPYVQESTIVTETNTADYIPTTTVGYAPEVIETTTEEETTTAADVPSTTVGYAPEVIETTTEEETTTYGYAPEVIETTTEEETTTAADVPSTTVGYAPEVIETTTEEETTTDGYAPEVTETTTEEEATTAADVPSTTVGYAPEVIETTTEEETTTAADVPSTTDGYVPEVVETTAAPYVEETTTVADVPACNEGASAIEPCSQLYNNCVNGEETVFNCESGLFFSAEQGHCTTADQIAECQQTKPYY